MSWDTIKGTWKERQVADFEARFADKVHSMDRP